MTADVEVGGRTRRVSARRDGNGWVVTLEGRELYADVAAAGGRWSLLIREGPAPGLPAADAGHRARSYEIAVESCGPGGQVIHVDGQAVPAAMAGARTRFGRRPRDASSAAGPARLTSPMPGRVVRILARAGDAVAAGQPLVVVEAMKMENELRAPKGGTVIDVRVSEGASVDANTVVMVVE